MSNCTECGLAQPDDGGDLHYQDCSQHDAVTCVGCIELAEECDCPEAKHD